MRPAPYRLAFSTSTMDSPIGARLTNSINRFYGEDRCDADLMLFYSELGKHPRIPMFACMNQVESYSYSGDVIATDFDSAASLLKSPGPKRKFFHVSEPEWTRLRGSQAYLDLVQVYRHPLLHILAADDEVKSLVERCWNRQVFKVVDVDGMDRVVKELRC